MHKVLALDLATNVGFASGVPGSGPDFGSYRLPSTGDDVGAYAYAFEQFVAPLILRIQPTIIVFCATILPPGRTSTQTQRKLCGLAWHTEFTAKRFEIRCFELFEAQVRMVFLGKGAKKITTTSGAVITLKDQVEGRCRELGWNTTDQDQSDACAAWAFACARVDGVNGAKFVRGPIQKATRG